jgi:methylmalonyl-CoA mutase N-terminal domain/subunit
MARLAALKQRRDNRRVKNLLGKLEQTAIGNENLLPVILECVESYATLGEICGALRRVFGEYKPTMAL